MKTVMPAICGTEEVRTDFIWPEAFYFYENTDNSPEQVCKYLADTQFDADGNLDKPNEAAQQVLKLAQSDSDAEQDGLYWFDLWGAAAKTFHADAARRQVGKPTPITDAIEVAQVGEEPPKMNDADLIGVDHPDMQELLQKPFTFMIGSLYGMKDRRNTQDGDWQATTMPLLAWMQGQDKGKNSWGLTRHPVAKAKEGSSIVLAETINGSRKDAAVETMSAIGLDIDSGAALDDVLDKLEEKGLFAIVYTSFSHGKSVLDLKHDDIMRKMKLEESPNRAQVQQYLREHHKDRYDETFIDSIKIVEARKQTADGLRVILETPPLDKFRVVLPLWEPVKLADLAPTVNQWKDVWADAVTGVAANMLGVSFDATSCDVNRLFFTPRHHENADDWYCAVVQGRPLRFEEIEPSSKNAYVKNRGEPTDPFAAGLDLDDGKRETFMTPGGIHLNKWHNTHKERFLMADVIEHQCSDKIRTSGNEKVGTVHMECVFEHEHSNEGGTATMAMNPDANSEGYWTVFCRHDACQGRDKLEFLKQMVEDNWFEESVLTDEEWNLGAADDAHEPVSMARATINAEIDSANLDKESSEQEIRGFVKKLSKSKPDLTTLQHAKELLAEKTILKTRELNSIFKEVKTELRASARGKSNIPVINQDNFKDMVQHGEDALATANNEAEVPVVFTYEDDVAIIRNGQRDMITKDQFEALVNDQTTWHHSSTLGDVERLREVSMPNDVIKQMFNQRDKPYPQLVGIKSTPYFSADGSLIVQEGYNPDTQTVLQLNGLVVERVSAVPSDDEVREATRLLVGEVFGDFPFEGVNDRNELLKRGLSNNGEALPSLAHAFALTLQPFAREMINGVTPVFTLTKPAAGTGGGRLVEVSSLIATGEEAAAQPMPTNEEELSKTITAGVNFASEYCFFDNTNLAADSAAFAAAITAPKYRARLLGSSRMVEAEIRHTWVMVANNIKGTTEILRRLVMIELDAKVADPENRSDWHGNPPGN